ncbi:MAG: hypothetical protein HY302_02305 [Opitutae bacterium]|nr:hypothetical protein [Opitutae bacterium]
MANDTFTRFSDFPPLSREAKLSRPAIVIQRLRGFLPRVLLGTGSIALLALSRGEPVNAHWMVVAAIDYGYFPPHSDAVPHPR